MKLPESFYQRSNVAKIARELLGKGLFTKIHNVVTGGIIVETEAYSWKSEDAMLLMPGRRSGIP